MAPVDSRLYSEHERRRWLRPDWQRWVRHDAHRFLPPGQVEAKARAVVEDQAALEAEQEELRASIQHLRLLVKDLKIDLAIRRLWRKYDGQPRDEGGRYDFGRRDKDARRRNLSSCRKTLILLRSG
jgi:hypothetical protein